MSGQRFPKRDRLRKRPEFLRVQQRGIKVSAGCLLALALKSNQARTRVGITVSSKVGGAVVRNRVRRRLRELWRKRREIVPSGLELVLVAKPSAAAADFGELSADFEELARKLSERAA
ncbi:MAG: ribonuclease P protein component [Myxococcales bacterium]|nr:ribonuclease P protein component [Myxococcales bacterium]